MNPDKTSITLEELDALEDKVVHRWGEYHPREQYALVLRLMATVRALWPGCEDESEPPNEVERLRTQRDQAIEMAVIYGNRSYTWVCEELGMTLEQWVKERDGE